MKTSDHKPPRNDIDRLQQQVQYYRRQTDELAGEILKLEYTTYGLRQEAKQKDRSLALLKKLQQSIRPQQERSTMIEIALPAICSVAAMDKCGFLEFRDADGCYWVEFTKESGFRSMDIPLMIETKDRIRLVNRSTAITADIENLQQQVALPFLVCVPLIVDDVSTGLLVAGRMREIRPTHPALNDGDILTLQAVSDLISATLQNKRIALLEAQLQEQSSKLKLAAQIQLDLLPKAFPQLEGYDIAGTTVSAETVGGDYFDFISVEDGCLAVCLGDVSGKGLPASLLMANLQATIRGQTLWSPSPRDCLDHANHLLFRSTDTRKYATLFYGILNTESNSFSYSNAGHNPPMFLCGTDEPVRLNKGGPVLGVFDDVMFEEDVISFNKGDLLLLYSDGITEAMNAAEQEFGEGKLLETIIENQKLSVADLIQRVLENVAIHVGKQRQFDDMTLVAIRRK